MRQIEEEKWVVLEQECLATEEAEKQRQEQDKKLAKSGLQLLLWRGILLS